MWRAVAVALCLIGAPASALVSIVNDAPQHGSGGLAIDGNPAGTYATLIGTNIALNPISTSSGNVVCFIGGLSNDFPITSVTDTAGLTWASRASANTGGAAYVELWWAKSVSPLTNDTITVNFNNSISYFSYAPWCVSGANFASPFDPNGVLPVQISGGCGLQVSTTNANTMVFGVFRSNSATPTAGAGYTAIASGTLGFILDEYKVYASAQTNVSVPISGSVSEPACIGDAVTQ